MGFQGALGPPSVEPEIWQSESTMGRLVPLWETLTHWLAGR